ncbi:ParA family protein [Micrococcus sp. ACRRV]|uniref:ParA family protein n=1 Tax=Micrococcus sp. ACRRV TaxID=2918203 RepID=UPI001EF23A27|nr:ParA family protein [Micrococcus sp. ACRRV]MCG7422634.1 ParA family protein [Micrococcus sp. ACRRV]
MAPPPVTIAFIASKGGVGKTMGTICLAAALTHAGHSVEVLDADPQGSASEWLEIAAEERPTGTPIPFTHRAVNLSGLKRLRPSTDFVVIDTPPGTPDIQSAAAAAADLVIIPTTPSADDIARTWATVDALGPTVRLVALLNQANPRTKLFTQVVDLLAAENVPQLATTIPTRESFKHTHGTYPTRTALGPWLQVAEEIQEMTRP